MSYNTHHSRSPQRQLPLFKAAAYVFGPSKADRLASAIKIAQDARKGMFNAYAVHCAALGRANGLPLQYRQEAKRDAFLRINMWRKALRENARKVADMQAELVALMTAPGVA